MVKVQVQLPVANALSSSMKSAREKGKLSVSGSVNIT